MNVRHVGIHVEARSFEKNSRAQMAIRNPFLDPMQDVQTSNSEPIGSNPHDPCGKIVLFRFRKAIPIDPEKKVESGVACDAFSLAMDLEIEKRFSSKTIH